MTHQITVTREQQWIDWLKKNHLKENKVFLISYKKHTGKASISHNQAMRIAICHGWIDTTVKKIDDEKYGRYFMKRTKNSRWSTSTLRYGKEELEKGKMTEFGLKMYKEGLAKPTIDSGLSKNPDTPKELLKELQKNKKALDFFNKLAPSYRRSYIVRVVGAKLPETKKKRVAWVVERCKLGKKPSDV